MKQRRAQIIVDGNFQYRFVLVGILVAFLLINTTLIIGYLASDVIFFDASPQVIFSIAIGLTEIVGLILFFLLSMKSSHRIAGPLHQLEQNLKRIGGGDLTTKTCFRKADHFHGLGAQLNQTTQQLCKHYKGLKETTEILVSQLDDEAVASESLHRLRKQLSEFKTGLDEDNSAIADYERSPLELDK